MTILKVTWLINRNWESYSKLGCCCCDIPEDTLPLVNAGFNFKSTYLMGDDYE